MADEALLALRGRVVTMDDDDTVIDHGIVYIRGTHIAAVADEDDPPPAGFEGVRPRKVGGSIYPGLIDLHNHLSYDALPMWQVPDRYENRDQWARHPDYRRLISGPMNVLGKTRGYPEAIAHYAECKSLLGGVTTSQGIALFSNAGIRRYYKGLLRNVEISGGPDLPAADARIGDVEAEDAGRFLAHLQRCSCLLLHLSEGRDDRAHTHFRALTLDDGSVAITDALAGIHCVALKREDFELMAAHGASMVWSPLSNLLLYGQTADVAAAKAAGLTIGLGSDWSPSGSKNLLGELKAAHACNRAAGEPFSARDIVAMATRNAAKLLKWEQGVGSLQAGKRADLIAVRSKVRDPYMQLIRADETRIGLVMIDGVRRYGLRSLMPDDRRLEKWSLRSRPRRLDLRGTDLDPLSAQLTLAETTARLKRGLKRLKQLAHDLEHPRTSAHAGADAQPQWFLELEQDEPPGVSLRTRFLDSADAPVKVSAMPMMRAVPLSELLGPVTLDPLTVVQDSGFVDRLAEQANIPAPVMVELRKLYD
ncbi:MAG TPA: amidohydrolase family protein [Luteimonas sp.]